jgi:hypothetical protein
VLHPSEILGALAALQAAGPVEVRENGARVASLADFQYEVRAQGSGTLLHLWSSERSLARRVVRIAEQSAERLVIEAEHFGRAKPDRLEFTTGGERPAARLTREQFREAFTELLHSQFPDEEILALAASADLEHSLSGRYTRALLRGRDASWAALAVAPSESAAAIDAALTFGLLWMDYARGRSKRGQFAGLRLFLPEGSGKLLAHRAKALRKSMNVEFYELNGALGRARRVDANALGNVMTWLVARREVEGILAAAAREIEPIRKMAPDAIAANVVPGTREIALRYRGADFARWRDGAIFFGLGDARRLLTHASRPELDKLIRSLAAHRHPAAQNTSHALYRMQPERWLETLVAADPGRIDARLDPRFLYTQVPAFAASDRGVIDLLGVTHDGRLAILELKAGEDIHLSLQAADYWLRVRWHQEQGDLRRYGYFPGIELRPGPPLLFLVAPAIRFHPATSTLLPYLSEEIEVARVGLAENWRRGLKVVLRQ